MAYTHDSDLTFLENCENQDLEVLQHYLIFDTDGKERYTQELTKKPLYRKYHPNHQKYWKNIVEELQLYGANSVMNILRGGKGVSYREILCDVCERLKVDHAQDESIDFIEANLLVKILTDSIDQMTPEELEQLVAQLNLDPANMSKEAIIETLKTSGIVLGSSAGVTLAGIVAAAIASSLIGSSIISTFLTALAGFGATTLGVLLGPVGLIVASGYAVGGPAYRVTIPSVIQVAYMRAKMKNNEAEQS